MSRFLINYFIVCTMIYSLVQIGISIIRGKIETALEKQGILDQCKRVANIGGYIRVFFYCFIPIINIYMLLITFKMASLQDIDRIEFKEVKEKEER